MTGPRLNIAAGEAVLTDLRRRRRHGEQQQLASPPTVAPAMQRASAINPRRPDWMWFPRIPGGVISIIGAKGGSCKGLTCASLAAAVSTGGSWPDGSGPAVQGNVLWCEAEDPLPEVVVPRMIAAGAALNRVWVATRAAFAAQQDLRAHIVNNDIRLVVLSPMVSFLRLEDISGELAVRDVLERMQASIEGTPCAIVGIAHSNKKADLAAIERILGAVAFTNYVRSVLLTAPDEQSEEGSYRLVHAKHNLSQKADDLVMRPVYGGDDPEHRDQYVRLEWSVPAENCDAEALFDRRHKANGNANTETAEQWLVAFLRQNGETARNDVIAAGQTANKSKDAILKAATRCPSVTWRQDGHKGPFFWSLARTSSDKSPGGVRPVRAV